MIRELVAEVRGDGIVPRQSAVIRGRCCEDHVRAELGNIGLWDCREVQCYMRGHTS